MRPKLTLYSRANCCLCGEMKAVIAEVAAKMPLDLEEINVDGAKELQQRFGNEVPVLFIEGRKAFKYQVTASELANRLRKRDGS